MEHDANLRKVLQRAREVNLKLTPKKCKFRLDQVPYVWHLFTKEGLKPDEAKVKAIREMPSPDSPEALRRFLGMINYLHKFISNLSDKTAPLRQLLRNDIHWIWEDPQQQAFEALKSDISQAPVLKFFNHSKPVIRCLLMPLRVVLVLFACRMGTLWPMPRALSRKLNLDMRKSRKNSSLQHLHARSFMISSMVEKPSLKLTTSLLLQLSTSLFIPHPPVCNVCCYSFRGTI